MAWPGQVTRSSHSAEEAATSRDARKTHRERERPREKGRGLDGGKAGRIAASGQSERPLSRRLEVLLSVSSFVFFSEQPVNQREHARTNERNKPWEEKEGDEKCLLTRGLRDVKKKNESEG
eukprot:scaffold275727_cov27-Tisochrysis_lutea.AAC.1